MKSTRQLNMIHVYCITTGAMISSGIFILPGMAHALAGPAVIFSYFLAGVLALLGILSIAELTTAMPKAGGDYFYISRGLGPAAGTVSAILSWFSLSLKSAFALVGLALLISSKFGINWHITASIFCLIFTAINLYGTKEAASFQVVLVVVLLIIMMVFIATGFSKINMDYYQPFVPYGLKSVFATTGFVFVSYGGLIQVASIAGEIREPGKIIPKGMILAIASMVLVYTLMIFVISGVLGSQQLDNSLTPVSDAAEITMVNAGYYIIAIAASLAFITTANAGILTASRYLQALGSDELLPEFLTRKSKRQIPYMAVILTGAFILLSVFLNLKILVEAASTVFVLGYILASLAIIVIRESGVHNYHPSYRAPFYPWLQIVTIIGFAFVLFEMGEDSFFITAIIIFIAFMVYWFYGRKNVQKDSALLHLIEKITDKKLVTGQLENELKEIIRERDMITPDEFDNVVENCEVIDIKEKISIDELFAKTSAILEEKLKVDQQQISRLLIERENKNSTVLTPNLAIPHIVIDGDGVFEMVMARCKQGVVFSPTRKNIKVVFVLVGTKDKRNLYLRTLAGIAQIFQSKEIEHKWEKALNRQGLKDIILLGKRKRF